MSDCNLGHDAASFLLSGVVCVGVVLSYAPQIARIVLSGSSLGFSPWYLFLGATASTSSVFNVVTLQRDILRCCAVWSPSGCVEHSMGIMQTGLQWLSFCAIFALFLAYYPRAFADKKHRRRHAKRTRAPSTHLQPPEDDGHVSSGSDSDLESFSSHIHQSYGAVPDVDPVGIRSEATHAAREHDSLLQNVPGSMRRIMKQHRSTADPNVAGTLGDRAEWKTAKVLASVAAAHLLCVAGVTLWVNGRHSYACRHSWATFLGITSTALAIAQYLPQIIHTARTRLVQSLSLVTMGVQIPGSFLFIYTLAGRPGTDWTTLLTYIVASGMQLVLFLLCVAWRIRQSRLQIDDYGRPLALIVQ